jgi:sugar phosphate isomerase/epimerase
MQLSMTQLRELRSLADANGLGFHAIGSPHGKVDIEAPEWESLDGVRTAASAAHAVGCERVRVFSFYRGENVGADSIRGQVLDRLGAMCDLADSAGVTLVHENERGIYGDTADRCRDLFDSLPLLRGCFDFANFVQAGQDTVAAWKLLRDRTLYFDVKDAVASTGRVVPAGEGDGSLAEIFADALANGFSDRFNLEPHLKTAGQFGGTTGPELFEVAVEALRKTLRQAGGS